MDEITADNVPTLEEPLRAYTAPADVLLDKVQLGFEVPFSDIPADRAAALCAELFRRRILARRARAGRTLDTALHLADIPVELAEGGRGWVGGVLRLAASKAGFLIATSSSRLVINPLRDLRTQLVAPGPAALDGNDNVVWEHGPEWDHLMGLQLVNVAAVVNHIAQGLAAAAATVGSAVPALPGRIWVQQCEVCRDYRQADAEALVADLAQRPIPGAVRLTQRRVEVQERNLHCIAWRGRAKTAPELKVYPKRGNLMRVEVALRDRETVRALLASRSEEGPTSAPFRGEEAAALLADLAVLAAPLIHEVRQMIAGVAEAPARTGCDLLLGFAPLVHLARPAPRQAAAGGRLPGASVPGKARRAISKLLDYGVFDTRGLRESDAILKALRQMAKDGTLTAPARGQRLFAVVPALDTARRSLASARPAVGEAHEATAEPQHPNA